MSQRVIGICVVLLLGAAGMRVGAQTAPTRDPQALTVAARALTALGGGAIHDVVLTGTVTRTAGDTEQGTARLEATAAGQSRVEFDLPDGPHVWVRDSSAPVPTGEWSGPDGKAHPIALHNVWSEPVWFFPALGEIARLGGSADDATLAIALAGEEVRNGEALLHLRLSRQVAADSPETSAALARQSAVDLYLDAATDLPRFLEFTAHPDHNFNMNLPVEIEFSDYRAVQGVEVPFHIQKRLRGTLLLDLAIQYATVNAGVPASDFHLQ